jgi:hypothetical protein
MAPLPTPKQLKPFLATADRRLPVGMREGTGSVYVYSYGNRTVKKFADMFEDPDIHKNTHKNPQMDTTRDGPSHIIADRLLHASPIKKTYVGSDDIIDLRNTDYIDAHIFTLRPVTNRGLGLFTGSSTTSSDGKYRLFTANQLITRFYGRQHKTEATSNSYSQHATYFTPEGKEKIDFGFFTPEADEYKRLAHFMNHNAEDPSCEMITNADGYIDVVVRESCSLIDTETKALPPGTELTIDYGEDYPYIDHGFTRDSSKMEEEDEEEGEGEAAAAAAGHDDQMEEEGSGEQSQLALDIHNAGIAAANLAPRHVISLDISEAVWESLIDEFDGM